VFGFSLDYELANFSHYGFLSRIGYLSPQLLQNVIARITIFNTNLKIKQSIFIYKGKSVKVCQMVEKLKL